METSALARSLSITLLITLLALSLPNFTGYGTEAIDREWISIMVASPEDAPLVREAIASIGIEVGPEFIYIPFVQALAYPSQIREIEGLKGVVSVRVQEPISFCQDISVPSMKAAPSPEYSPETAHDLGYTGSGITIAILDGGVDNEHPTFNGAFVAGADFSVPESPLNPRDGSVDPDDIEGHGTPVASVALGRGDDAGNYVGMAPNAGLIDLKIRKLGPTLPGPMTEAIEWCIANQGTQWGNGYIGVDVISISAGLGAIDGTVASAVKEAVSRGIVVVSAATNSGTSFSDNPNRDNDYWVDEAIIAGGTETLGTVDRSDDVYWPQSTWGPRTSDGDDDIYDEMRPDVSAPGAELTLAAHSALSDVTPASGYGTYSGTSYSTPHVSGLVALMLEANPEILPDEIIHPARLILHRSAEARGEPYSPRTSDKYDIHFGYGIIDAYEAVVMARDYEDERTAPYVESLEVQPLTNPGETVTVSASALDLEEQAIEYELRADGGTIEPRGSPRTWDWTAPEGLGRYTLTLTVTDTDGMRDESSVEVEVISGPVNSPPVIDRIDISRSILGPGETADIRVRADDPDGDDITYSFSADRGTLEPDGDRAIFTAPDQIGTATITVRVVDPSGLSDEGTIGITVRQDISGDPPEVSVFRSDPARIKAGFSGEMVLEAFVVKGSFDIASVRVDLTSLGMEEDLVLSDDGTSPDRVADDRYFTGSIDGMEGLKAGRYDISVKVMDTAGFYDERSYTLVVEGSVDGSGDGDVHLPSPLLLVLAGVILFIILALGIFVIVWATNRS